MKAAVQLEYCEPLTIEDVKLDDLEPTELLLRTAATGLCHSDLHYIEGTWKEPLPIVLGHEASAVVEAVGSAVTVAQPGDHVIVFCAPACGRCRQCLEGRVHLCTESPLSRPEGRPPRLLIDDEPVGALCGLGTFAEQMVVYESSVVKVRKDMPLDKAALISCAVITGFGAAVNTARVRPGQSVAVIGVGGVGLNAIQGARFAGAQRIIAVDMLQTNLSLAAELGATDTIDAAEVDAVEAVRDISAGGVDHAIEAIGLTQTAEQAFGMLRGGGTATVIGMLPPEGSVRLPTVPFLEERKIQGCHMGSAKFKLDLPMLVDLYLDGRLQLDALVCDRIGLADINEGFDTLRAGRRARSVIVF